MIDVKTKIIETRKAYGNTYDIKETIITITTAEVFIRISSRS